MKEKALKKHSLHEKTAASALLKLFISRKSQVGEDSQKDRDRKTTVGSPPDIVTEVHQIQNGLTPKPVSGEYLFLC